MKKVQFYLEFFELFLEILSNEFNEKTVIPFIENSIIEMRDVYIILRLIILQSLVGKGLKSNVFDTYRKLFSQVCIFKFFMFFRVTVSQNYNGGLSFSWLV